MASANETYNRYFRIGSEPNLETMIGDSILPVFSVRQGHRGDSKLEIRRGITTYQDRNMNRLGDYLTKFSRIGVHQIGIIYPDNLDSGMIPYAQIKLDNGYGQPVLTGYSQSIFPVSEINPDFFLLEIVVHLNNGTNPSSIAITGDREDPRNPVYADIPGFVIMSDFMMVAEKRKADQETGLVSALLLMLSNTTFRIDLNSSQHKPDYFIFNPDQKAEADQVVVNDVDTWFNNPVSASVIPTNEPLGTSKQLQPLECLSDEGTYINYVSSSQQFFMANWQLRKRLSLGENNTPFRNLTL